MNRNYIIGGLLVLVIVAVGIGAAVYTGFGPAPGGTDSGDKLTDFPTETQSGMDAQSTPTGNGVTTDTVSDGNIEQTATPTSTPPFSFTIDNIEDCGQTCRDVTASLHNNQNTMATNVTVFIRIFAGENNTASDDIVWEGKEEVGDLAAGGTHTTTERVELSLQEARKIDQNNGWITILTTVKTDDRTVTFKDSEKVA